MENFIENISRPFFEIEKWHSAVPLGDGHINDTYLIDFQENGLRQQWVLQKLNTDVFKRPETVHSNWIAIQNHLKSNGYPLKIPFLKLPKPQGTSISRSFDPPTFRCFPFFENTFSPENLASPAEIFEAARGYGLFLKHLADFPAGQVSETIPGFHDTSERWLFFLKTLKTDPAGRAKTTSATIEKMFAAEPIILKINVLKASGDLPARVVHNDTKAGNVLLDRRTKLAVAVIDWDTVMPGTVLSDFGDMVRSFAPDRPEGDVDFENLSLRPKVVEAMCRGFLAETKHFLTKTERENLFLGGLWIIAEQALRFLTDYLAGDVYYKINYPGQNLDRAQNQLALLRQIQFFEKEFKRMLV